MKRFTETTKWDDPWFLDLSAEHKAMWGYLCDKCDNAGVIDIAFRLASFSLNGRNAIQEMMEDFVDSGRLQKLENGKYFIKGFIAFQFGQLNKSSNLHKNVIALLQKHGIDSEKFKGSYTLHEPLMKEIGRAHV